jgi:hypothetical protein
MINKEGIIALVGYILLIGAMIKEWIKTGKITMIEKYIDKKYNKIVILVYIIISMIGIYSINEMRSSILAYLVLLSGMVPIIIKNIIKK